MENEIRNLENEIRNLENETLDLENETLDLENETLDLENETLDLENETLDLENETRENRKVKILAFINSQGYQPMLLQDMSYVLDVTASDKHIFADLINELEKDGEIVITKRGKIMRLNQLNIIKGIFTSTSRGFGFVNTDDTLAKDIYINSDNVNGAFHKDTVLCRVFPPGYYGRSQEGEIIKIIKRGLNTLVGTLDKNKYNAFVIPDDKKIYSDIYISLKNCENIVNGHKVVVKIIKPATGDNRRPEGKIIEVIGHKNDPGVDILSIIRHFDLPTEFSEKSLAQAKQIPQEVSAEECKYRLDLRNKFTVTIDSIDALDLDDAITIEKVNSIYKLGVHIADVSHYVKENSPLDKEALLRGTSIYLADRVIPMLPAALSNGICSLNAGVDRLSLSCIMEIDNQGNVIKHEIAESVIHVNKRCTYTGVSSAIDGIEANDEYAPFSEMFTIMAELRLILREKRLKRGSIEFEFPETKIVLDDKGNPVEIMPRQRDIASSIIEEFMLVTNETVAEQYFWLEAPFIYRSHEEPNIEKIERLTEFVRHFGFFIKGKSIHPKSIQALLRDIKGSDSEMIISKMALRSLKQARYTAANIGHFGLAAKYYCHFTSPIRRYPDLAIHRIIKDNLEGKLTAKEEGYNKKISEIARQSSITERSAEQAEREVEKLKKVQFMADKVGMEFAAIISGVTSFGIFVELPNTIEGGVSYSHITDDYYVYDERSMTANGEMSGKIYRLGQPVRVRLLCADLDNRRLDFVFC